MIVYKDVDQGTDEWSELRRGRLGASEYKHVITATGQLSKSAAAVKFMHKLALQLVADDPAEAEKQRKMSYNWDIDWGKRHESKARGWFRTHVMPVECVGYVVRHKGDSIGCSPDGLIPAEENGKWEAGAEFKCPSLSTHLEYLIKRELPAEYKIQVHGSMATTGLNCWYFMSYFPRLKPLLLKVERDSFTEKVGAALDEFTVAYEKERKLVFDTVLFDESEEAA